MICKKCGENVRIPTLCEKDTNMCMYCIKKMIPRISSPVRKNATSKFKCAFCNGIIYAVRTKEGVEVLTDNAVYGNMSAYHPVCKQRFVQLTTVHHPPEVKISSLAEMKRWIRG